MGIMMRTQELVRVFAIGSWVIVILSMLFGGEAAMDGYPAEQAHNECSLTRYPNLCDQTLREMGSGNQSVDIISALVRKAISETNLPTTFFAQFEAPHPQSVDTGYCSELMSMSVKRLKQSLEALKSPATNKHNLQTWLSASLTFLQSCKDHSHSYSHSSISVKMDYLSQLGSNLLALVNRMTSPKRRRPQQDRFPAWVSARERKLVEGGGTVKANAVVAQDGSGNYRTVSEAVEAAPGTSRFVIYVKEGVYREKIRSSKDGITLVGVGKYSTIIVGDHSVAHGTSLDASATFTIDGDGFIARDIGFHNNAGPEGEQAVALNIASDRSVLYRCSIAGYQDTLYAHALRQFYRECDIYGTIDFIFGNAAAVFQSCNLVLRRPQSGGYNVILANGRTDPGQNTGFSVQKCSIGAGSDFSAVKRSYISYLGRPWKEYSRSVVMESTIDDAIVGRGWIEWPGYGSSVLKTLYFAEYANEGPGAGTAQRVRWPGFHVIGADEAVKFTVGSFIAGTSWIPSTGVTFISGLN